MINSITISDLFMYRSRVLCLEYKETSALMQEKSVLSHCCKNPLARSLRLHYGKHIMCIKTSWCLCMWEQYKHRQAQKYKLLTELVTVVDQELNAFSLRLVSTYSCVSYPISVAFCVFHPPVWPVCLRSTQTQCSHTLLTFFSAFLLFPFSVICSSNIIIFLFLINHRDTKRPHHTWA